MPVIDDDPVTPEALSGVFRDARDLGRPVQIFTIALQPSRGPRAVDQATLAAIRALRSRKDIETSAGSITVLMKGETAGVVVAQPTGAPSLKDVGAALLGAIASDLGGGVQVAMGMATTAEHADLELDDAIAVAMEGLEVASASGTSGVVHSELYELTLATRRRLGTVYPLESVQDLEDLGGTAHRAPQPHASDADASARAGTPDNSEDDPFAHLAGDAYALAPENAELLVGGIAPRSLNVTAAERASQAELERLRLELELARREKAQAEGSTRSEVEKQERRIAKLMTQLELAEEEIGALRRDQAADPGVASTFRKVQGLDPKASDARVKRVLIDGVFEANQPDIDPDQATQQGA